MMDVTLDVEYINEIFCYRSIKPWAPIWRYEWNTSCLASYRLCIPYKTLACRMRRLDVCLYTYNLCMLNTRGHLFSRMFTTCCRMSRSIKHILIYPKRCFSPAHTCSTVICAVSAQLCASLSDVCGCVFVCGFVSGKGIVLQQCQCSWTHEEAGAKEDYGFA